MSNNQINKFKKQSKAEVNKQSKDKKFINISKKWLLESHRLKYTYHFNWFGIPIILNSEDKKYKLSVMNRLNKRGVMTRPIISGNFSKQPSIKLYNIKTGSKLHNADMIDKKAFFLGLHNIKITPKKLKFLTESIYSSL